MNRIASLERALDKRQRELEEVQGAVRVAQAAVDEAAQATETAVGYEAWNEAKSRLEFAQREFARGDYERRLASAHENCQCAAKAVETAKAEAELEALTERAKIETFFRRVLDHGEPIDAAYRDCLDAQRELLARNERKRPSNAFGHYPTSEPSIREFHKQHARVLIEVRRDGAEAARAWLGSFFQGPVVRVSGYEIVKAGVDPVLLVRLALDDPTMPSEERSRKYWEIRDRQDKAIRYLVRRNLDERAHVVSLLWSDGKTTGVEPLARLNGRDVSAWDLARGSPGILDRIGRVLGIAAE